MRSLIKLFFLLVLTQYFVACEKDDDDNNTTNSTSNNTKNNGNNGGGNNQPVNIMKARFDNNLENLTPSFVLTSDTIVISGLFNPTGGYPTFSILFKDTMKERTYSWTSTNPFSPIPPYFNYIVSEDSVLYMHYGSLTLSTFDTANRKIVGTFEGTLKPFIIGGSSPDSIVVSDGEFDFSY